MGDTTSMTMNMISWMNPLDEIVALQRNTDEPVNVITPEELLCAQADDIFCLSIRSRLNGGKDLPCRIAVI